MRILTSDTNSEARSNSDTTLKAAVLARANSDTKIDDTNRLTNVEASRKAHRDALWICYSNEEVGEINKEQTNLLRTQGEQKYTIWAK